MFALVLMALLVLLALTSLMVLADSGLRWWSAFGALKRQLTQCDCTCALTPTAANRRSADHARTHHSRRLTPRVSLRVAA